MFGRSHVLHVSDTPLIASQGKPILMSGREQE